MTYSDLVAMAPLVVLALTIVALMMAIAFHRSHGLTAGLALTGLGLALASIVAAWRAAPRAVTPLLAIDGYALFYAGLFLVATLGVTVLAYGYMERQGGYREEFYPLLLLATLGATVLAASNHFASLYLGLEILSVSLYGLIAYLVDRQRSIEAGVKYLVLAAASAAFLLFGVALIYADQGTMAFDLIQWSPTIAGGATHSVLLLVGLAMIVVGVGFKLAVVPFHLWTPDVYEGAPAPITAFVATVSKGGVVAVLLRLFARVDLAVYPSLFAALGLIAAASMLAGNLLALLQNNVKRVLAYSSIAHLGYLLVAILAGGSLAIRVAAFYLAAYFAATMGAFGAVTVLSGRERDAELLDDYRGLFWRRPGLAVILAASLLSLAGIPLTAGFVGEFYVLRAGVGSALWWLVIVLVVSSVIGLYYYLRIIVAMLVQPGPEEKAVWVGPALPLTGGVTLAVLGLVVLWLGVYPTPLLKLIETAAAGLL
jgi:NADH-quinone oxidoreductase subunit N